MADTIRNNTKGSIQAVYGRTVKERVWTLLYHGSDEAAAQAVHDEYIAEHTGGVDDEVLWPDTKTITIEPREAIERTLAVTAEDDAKLAEYQATQAELDAAADAEDAGSEDDAAENERRAEDARAALEVFAKRTNGPIEDEGIQTVIVDLLSNLAHLCDSEGADINAAIKTARTHYEAVATDGGYQFEDAFIDAPETTPEPTTPTWNGDTLAVTLTAGEVSDLADVLADYAQDQESYIKNGSIELDYALTGLTQKEDQLKAVATVTRKLGQAQLAEQFDTLAASLFPDDGDDDDDDDGDGDDDGGGSKPSPAPVHLTCISDEELAAERDALSPEDRAKVDALPVLNDDDAPLTPVSAEQAAERAARFDGYEVAPVTSIWTGCGTVGVDDICEAHESLADAQAAIDECDQPANEKRIVWTLYGHLTTGGVQAIVDVETEADALQYLYRITGQRVTPTGQRTIYQLPQ